ncbi:MAG: HNH endonuclease [Rubricoccaceae bacterium]|nr:HNH endonuclease [Rubricoccaceae bacterium]
MDNEILSYFEMCQREGKSLQQGMNFGIGGDHSVILTSVRPNAPYNDRFEDGGTVLIYEGHDARRGRGRPDPKTVDQPAVYPTGTLTQNGRFHVAASEYKAGAREPERVRVYEKLHSGIWSYNGLFHLVDSWQEESGGRAVFKFKLVAVAEEAPTAAKRPPPRRRMIPSSVKREVWKRDRGRCAVCGAQDELHFDHVIPYSRGGASATTENVQILCARHNLGKGSRIE